MLDVRSRPVEFQIHQRPAPAGDALGQGRGRRRAGESDLERSDAAGS